MLGYLEQDTFRKPLVVLSDEAKQFDLNNNAGCWVHAERKLTNLISNDEQQVKQKEKKLNQFWKLCNTLKTERAN